MSRRPTKGSIASGLALTFALFAHTASAQMDSLALSSGTAGANGTVSLNLPLLPPAGSEPSAIQWTFTYPASNVVSISATVGASATSAGKALSCFSASGAYTCLASGINANTIANGTVATLNLAMAAG